MSMFVLLITSIRLLCFSSQLDYWETRLNSDVFQEREQAEVALLKQGSLQLCRDLIRSSYPEVRRRARLVYWRKLELILKSLEPCPCLDTLWYNCTKRSYDYDCPRKRKLDCYIDRYRLTSPCTYPWMAYRDATRDWTGELIDDGWPVLAIQILHKEMHRRDKLANCYYK